MSEIVSQFKCPYCGTLMGFNTDRHGFHLHSGWTKAWYECPSCHTRGPIVENDVPKEISTDDEERLAIRKKNLELLMVSKSVCVDHDPVWLWENRIAAACANCSYMKVSTLPDAERNVREARQAIRNRAWSTEKDRVSRIRVMGMVYKRYADTMEWRRKKLLEYKAERDKLRAAQKSLRDARKMEESNA